MFSLLKPSRAISAVEIGLVLLFLALPERAHAYIGPGAGFVLVSSFFILIFTFLLAFLTLLVWPARWILGAWRARKALAKSRVRKVVVLGLDGLDPELTEKWMNEGLLPNFARLRDDGVFRRLETTLPAMSPVAWSSFQTGCNPGRHGIFDFLSPNRKNYLPELSSARIGALSRPLRLGPFRIPIRKPSLRLLRKNQPFWKILGDHGIFSNVLRVPITFPPEKFRGLLLSGMCVPDLRGTQGTFTFYTSDPEEKSERTSGVVVPVEARNGAVRATISGPPAPGGKGKELEIPLEIRLNKNGDGATLHLNKEKYPLPLGAYTPWIPVTFRAGRFARVRGICRFYLQSLSPHFRLYASPIHVDPSNPALPISHPFAYAMYLARTQGPFATLGLAEDTWALNEGILDEKAFLEQTWLNHAEREKMFFDAVEKTSRGLVVCVFDATDRIQHMFWQYLDEDHPAARDKDAAKYRETILDLYRKADDLLGRTRAALGKDTVLIVMSDHGFKSFRRGVNLNTWLQDNGFLTLKKEGKFLLRDAYGHIDWSSTQAYAVGLGGIYLNLRGREAQGIVSPGEEAAEIKRKIADGLRALRDPDTGEPVVREVYAAEEIYNGPYVNQAPDLMVGFARGYRVSWDCAAGAIYGYVKPGIFGVRPLLPGVIEDNTKNWSGDHCVNPVDVPGVFFSNREISRETPRIMDIAPTILDLFGVRVPAYCDGKPLMEEKGED